MGGFASSLSVASSFCCVGDKREGESQGFSASIPQALPPSMDHLFWDLCATVECPTSCSLRLLLLMKGGSGKRVMLAPILSTHSPQWPLPHSLDACTTSRDCLVYSLPHLSPERLGKPMGRSLQVSTGSVLKDAPAFPDSHTSPYLAFDSFLQF